jgi:stage III sporulation protein AF
MRRDLDILAEIVKTVLVIIIVASFLELLLPESSLKPFVSFTMGLFVLIAILNPLLNIAFKDRGLEIDLWDHKYDQALEDKMLEKGLDINQQVMESNDQQIQEKMQGQIGAIASLVPGVHEVKARIDKGDSGTVEQILLFVNMEIKIEEEQGNEVIVFGDNQAEIKASLEEQEQIKNKIMALLNNLYGINTEQINIIFEGGNS